MLLGHGSGNVQETSSTKCRKRVLEKHLSSLSKVESCVLIISGNYYQANYYQNLETIHSSDIFQDTELYASLMVKTQVYIDASSLSVT